MQGFFSQIKDQQSNLDGAAAHHRPDSGNCSKAQIHLTSVGEELHAPSARAPTIGLKIVLLRNDVKLTEDEGVKNVTLHYSLKQI